MPTIKRGEFVVTADSVWGIQRGLNVAMKAIEEGKNSGEASIDKHGVRVMWRTNDVVTSNADEVLAGSLVDPAPAAGNLELPDISAMDIEDARGVVGVASSLDELEVLESVEMSSARTPGGRKGVLAYIERRRKEISELIEKKAKIEAGKEA